MNARALSKSQRNDSSDVLARLARFGELEGEARNSDPAYAGSRLLLIVASVLSATGSALLICSMALNAFPESGFARTLLSICSVLS